jgi:CTP:molybdopterin cytidylyltransferase MocA
VKPAAIILSAGESRRMGRPKAHLPFRGGTFLSVLADTLGEFCAPVVAVFGAPGVIDCAPGNVMPVENPRYREGMLTSLQAGLRVVPGARRIMFALVDHPAIRRDTVSRLLQSTAEITIPRHDGKRGHPVIVSAAIAKEFLDEPGTEEVRIVINRHASRIDYVEVDDPAIYDDVDNPERYQALMDREGERV